MPSFTILNQKPESFLYNHNNKQRVYEKLDTYVPLSKLMHSQHIHKLLF